MTIKDIRGLKYPDEYMIKFFFKENLHTRRGSVLEFGCANGNNIALFYQYDYDVTGVDLLQKSIDDAEYNLENVYDSKGSSSFVCDDMLSFAKSNKNLKVDIFMIPNVISYIKKSDFIEFLKVSQENNLFKKDAKFFLRTRTKKDYRYGLGEEIEENTFLMKDDITGEKGALCTCYNEYELIELLKKYLNLTNIVVSHLDNQNLQNGRILLNSDIAIWGNIS
ncbi:MAG TPA: class I SAM-dependent methyltransferase [Bacteroidetes bacterium]|nr:class I SAM-dependent methyltransferase [Bacteroidota bacterium]